MQDRGPAAYLAEFIGTLMLVFFICAVVSLYGPEPSQQNPNPFIDYSVIGLVHVSGPVRADPDPRRHLAARTSTPR